MVETVVFFIEINDAEEPFIFLFCFLVFFGPQAAPLSFWKTCLAFTSPTVISWTENKEENKKGVTQRCAEQRQSNRLGDKKKKKKPEPAFLY